MKLTKSNYYSKEANRYYMSVSQFKDFVPSFGGCEARAIAKLNGDFEQSELPPFMEGHYVHAWNEGKLDEFKAKHPALYSSRGSTAGQLKANFRHCNKMIEVLEKAPYVMKALAGKKEVIMTGELFGIPWKARLDSYRPAEGTFTDLKVLKELDSKWWNKEARVYENFIEHYGYDIQMAIYAEIEKQVTGRDKWPVPHLVIVTKQEPPDHEIIYFDYEVIVDSLQIVQKHIERVKVVKSGQVEASRCEKCEYCRATKVIKQIKHFSEFSLY